MNARLLFASLLLATIIAPVQAQETAEPNWGFGNDQDFKAKVEQPAYRQNGPRLLFDRRRARHHHHEGFLKLLRADGYRLKESDSELTQARLTGVDVLALIDPGEFELERDPVLAITEPEATVVADWVVRGGSVLVAADSQACEALLRRFGMDASGGHLKYDRSLSDPQDVNFMLFTEAAGLLSDHPILRGRSESERIRKLVTTTPQTIKIPPEGSVLMSLPENVVEIAPSPKEENVGLTQTLHDRGTPAPQLPPGVPKGGIIILAKDVFEERPTKGRAPAVALRFGQGRVVVLGNSSMISAEYGYVPTRPLALTGDASMQPMEPVTTRKILIGMSHPGADNRQFTLNVMHWLSGLLN